MATSIISLNGNPLADTQARETAAALGTSVDTLGTRVDALGTRVDALEQAGTGVSIDDAATAEDSTWSSQKIAQEVGARLPQETFDRVFVITEPSANLYEPTTEGWTNYASLHSSGKVTVTDDTGNNYCVTPPIPIEGGKTYTITPKIAVDGLAAANRARTYTADGTACAVMEFTLNDDGSVTFTTPEYSEKIIFTVHKPTLANANNFDSAVLKFNTYFMLVEGTSAPESYIPYVPAQNTLRNIEIPDGSVKVSKIGGDGIPALLPLKGKVIANFGDSVFGNTRPPLDLSTMIAERTGATVHNCAFGGCRMGPHSGHWDAFSMYRLATAIASGDYSVQDEAITYSDRTSYAEEPLAEIKSIDFSTLDIMTIAYGGNDFNGNNPIDNADDPLDTTTVCGALRYSIETIQEAFPQIRIFILIPPFSVKLDSDGETIIDDTDAMTNSLGKTALEYWQAMEGVAKAYKLPVIDNYHELGINRNNWRIYFGSDNAHHNAAGLELLADHIARALW